MVEVDEELMALYLEQGEELSPEQLHDPFEKALREGHLVPVCFVSAETGAGVRELLDIFVRLMPNPTEGNPPPFLKGGGERVRGAVAPDPAKHVVAHVFKVSVDPYVGKLGIFRMHQGTVRPGSQLFVGDARKPFKIAHLYRLMGKETTEVPQGIPGDICAVAKVEELHFDAVLHDSHDEDQYHLKSDQLSAAMLGVAIEPERRGDEQRLADTLHKLTAEDPCVRIEHHASLNETVLYGMGEFHLRVLLERMTERYGVQVKTHPPSIPYRETITAPGRGALPAQETNRRRRPIRRGVTCASKRSSAARALSLSTKSSAERFPGNSFRRSRRACARCSPRARSPAFRCRISA